MPYCPKCDMEFVEGVLTCSDCGEALYESKEVALEEMETQHQTKQAELARQMEKMSELDGQPPTESEKPPVERAKVYIDKQQKYDDYKSSASAFLIVGSILALLTLLSLTGLFPLPMTGVTRIIFHGVLIGMVIFSFVIWNNNQKEAKKILPQIEREKKETDEILAWFLESYQKEDIDQQIDDIESLDDGIQSLKRFEIIQDLLVTTRDLPDPGYVDMLSEMIYAKLYEETVRSEGE